jgi:hypothetical protein
MWAGPRGVGPSYKEREEKGRESDRWGLVFKFNPNSLIQTDWTWFNPKSTFPNSKNLKQYMVGKYWKSGTTFPIETFSDSDWTSNENSEKLLGVEF